MGDDYTSERASLVDELATLRRNAAPPEYVSPVLANLVLLQLEHEDVAGSRATLAELDELRRSSAHPEVDAAYLVAASRLAALDKDPGRSQWFATGALGVARRHALVEFLPHALLRFSDALLGTERDEEARWARLEAIERFEALDLGAHAAAALLSLSIEGAPLDVEEAVARRAVALADTPHMRRWAWLRLGRCLKQRREYLPARRAFDLALAAEESAPGDAEPGSITSCLIELSWLEQEFGRPREALELARRAVDTAPEPAYLAIALETRADALSALHEHRAARDDLFAAARLYDETKDAFQAAWCRVNVNKQHQAIALHWLPSWIYPGPPTTLPPLVRPRVLATFFVAMGAVLGWALAWRAALVDTPRDWAHLALRLAVAGPPLLVLLTLVAFIGLTWRDQWRLGRVLRR